MSVVGQRIKERRLYWGYTQTELAEMTESSQKQIWEYETGKSSPSIDKITKLADALQTTTDWLLGRTNIVIAVYEGLDTQEKALVETYRAKSPEQQQKILDVVRIM